MNRSGRWQRLLQHAALAHERDDLAKPGDADFALLRHDAAVRLEIKRERLPRDVVGRSGRPRPSP